MKKRADEQKEKREKREERVRRVQEARMQKESSLKKTQVFISYLFPLD